ncbi:MAG TPA: type II toxin-antitoxin system prevent-host-death family antitoxin [Gemmatimonadales bacterium]|nr:type II toxin-antitoxin system prevent-host-death family antitoxin [Gemmatimonadales bacterium]
MATASVSDAKNQLSALLRLVQGGESVLITDRGVPVARLEPVRLGTGIPPRVVGLAQHGLVQLPDIEPTAGWLEAPRATPAPGPSGSDLLLDERRDAR